MANGAELQCTKEVLNCQWYTQGHTFSTTFKVLPLGCNIGDGLAGVPQPDANRLAAQVHTNRKQWLHCSPPRGRDQVTILCSHIQYITRQHAQEFSCHICCPTMLCRWGWPRSNSAIDPVLQAAAAAAPRAGEEKAGSAISRMICTEYLSILLSILGKHHSPAFQVSSESWN